MPHVPGMLTPRDVKTQIQKQLHATKLHSVETLSYKSREADESNFNSFKCKD